MNTPSQGAGAPTGTGVERIEADRVDQSVFSLFEQAAARHGDKLAVDDGVTRLTYRELRRAALHLAGDIAALVPMGCPVGILLPNGTRFPVAALACLAVGRPYVPIDPTYPAERNEQLVKEAGLVALIVDENQSGVPHVAAAIPRLNIASALGKSGDPTATVVSGSGPAVILYTSGSSGRPKGICYDQGTILERANHAIAALEIVPEDRVFLFASSTTIGGLRVPFSTLLSGATLYWADARQAGIDGAMRFLQYARPTTGFAVPALLRALLGLPGAKQAFADARVIHTGGDVHLRGDLALWRNVLPGSCRVFITLLSTEMPAVFQWLVPPDWEADGPQLPVGYPRPGMDFRIVDDNGVPVPVGAPGELVVNSAFLALGHWQDGHLQPEPFPRHTDNPEMRTLKTGDLVRMREDGLAEMIGRKDRQIKIRGFRIEPGDVENAIRGCAGVSKVAVITRRNRDGGISLVAYVVPDDPGSSLFLEALKKEIALRLPHHMRPSLIRLIDALPQLPGFKTDVQALQKLDEEQRATTDVAAAEKAYIPPRTSTERALAEIWCRMFKLERVGVRDNFFELGGDSLMLVDLVMETHSVLHTGIGAPDVFQNPSVEQLAALIDLRGPNSRREAGVVQFQEGVTGLPIYLIRAGPDEVRLARLMGDWPVFGIEVPWPLKWRHAAAENRASALPDLEQLAAPYVAELVAHAGASPCVLVGHSVAGLIAFEAARQFQEQGGRVEMVMIFDMWIGMPSKTRAAWRGLRQIWGQDPGCQPAQRASPPLRRRLRDSWLVLRWMLGRQALWQWVEHNARRVRAPEEVRLTTMTDEEGMPLAEELIFRLNKHAMKSYRPRSLDSRGVLFRTSESNEEYLLAADASKGWMNLFGRGLEIIPVKGDHLSMIRDEMNHSALADAIEQALKPLRRPHQ